MQNGIGDFIFDPSLFNQRDKQWTCLRDDHEMQVESINGLMVGVAGNCGLCSDDPNFSRACCFNSSSSTGFNNSVHWNFIKVFQCWNS